jgi:hypothetical protein
MKHVKKAIAAAVAGAALLGGLAACNHDSDVASKNLSNEADQFKVFRQIVVYNAITDKYILEIDGYCALGNHDPGDEVSYTCKTPQGYIKDIIKKSDNTFVFVHQLHPKNVSHDFFQVTLKLTEVIPNFNH